jgi:phytanoyl-CoA hydroxylase
MQKERKTMSDAICTQDDSARASSERRRGSLSEDQVRQYDREGYIVLLHLLTKADLGGVQEAMMQKVDEIADELFAAGEIEDKFEHEAFESRLARIFSGKSDQDFLRFGRSWRERRPGYYDLMINYKILDAVESLIGSEIFANPVYNTRPKVPGVAAGAVPWHQDKSYWPDANSNPVITVWIPLVDANFENGCLHIWPRTHKSRVLNYHSESLTGTNYTEIDSDELAKAGKAVEPVGIPLARGGAILFNDRCIHMSTPNMSNHVRWSVDLRYQPTDQDPMEAHGAGFLARSREYPERIATLSDWLASRPYHESQAQ